MLAAYLSGSEEDVHTRVWLLQVIRPSWSAEECTAQVKRWLQQQPRSSAQKASAAKKGGDWQNMVMAVLGGVRDSWLGGNQSGSGTGKSEDTMIEEDIDPDYEPTEAEIREYAEWFGMDLEEDEDLFWIPRAALTEPLPPGWKPVRSSDTGDIYYFNFETKESQWGHPIDEKYKKVYEEEKKKKKKRKKKFEAGEKTAARRGSSR